MMELLQKCYDGAMKGIPGSKSCEEMARDYLEKYSNARVAAEMMIDAQIAKCTTSGFLTSLGGLITLPIAIPANLGSVLYMQMRMIGAMAVIGGYDLNDDEVQTLIYLCLVRSSITDICKTAGVKVANKITMSMLKKLPGAVLTKINQKVGFRLLTKFGEKGVINLAKMVPLLGGVVGGTIDLVETKAIAEKAKKAFIDGVID